MENDVLIKYKDVVIRQGGYDIIANVSFTVKTGELVYIIGSVGTGKSSLLRTIYADLNLSGGNAVVLGYDMNKIKRRQIPDLRKREGIIFQDYKLLNDMTIAKNLEFVLRAIGMKQKAEIKERISKALDRVGLNGKDNKYPNELSGGEQQRAAIARAIINNPQVILADEPTGNLDKETALNVTRLLAEFSAGGTAVIMSTHNTDLITSFAGTVYRCGEGTFKDVTDEFRSVEDKDTLQEINRQ